MIRPLWVFLMVLVAWPTLAAAKPTRVVVGQIKGDDDGAVTAAINDAIGGDVSVVGKREVSKAEDKLGLSPELADKEIRKLLKELDADAVVKGSLEQTGDTQALHLKLYLRTNTKPKAFTLSFGSSKSEKFRATLRTTILDKLGAPIEGDGDKKPPEEEGETTKPKKPKKPPVESGEEEEAPKPKKPKKPPVESGEEEETPIPVKPKKPKKPKKPPPEDGEGSGSGSGEEEEEEEEVVVVKPSPHSANRDSVRVDAGVSVTARTLNFASRNFPQAPKPYTNGAVPGARVEGELYPISFASPDSPLAGLGFAFDYDKTLALTLRSTLADGTNVAAKADQQRFSFGGRFRFVFGKRPTSPSLTLGASYGVRRFAVNRTALTDPTQIDIPDIQYTSIQPGLGLRVPFASVVAFTLDARAVLVTDAGPIQLQTQYGQAKVTGGQLQAGIDIVIKDRFAVRFVGEYAQFGFAFVGNGTMAVNRDGDASSKDIGGASDRYIGGAVTLAVLY